MENTPTYTAKDFATDQDVRMVAPAVGIIVS